MTPENAIAEATEQPTDQATAFPPQYLPDLRAMADAAYFMQAHALRMHESGQRIVADFQAQLDSLKAEAASLESERRAAMDHINQAHECRMARNAAMRANVEGMIAFHTGALPAAPAAEITESSMPAAEVPRRPTRRGLLSLVSGAR